MEESSKNQNRGITKDDFGEKVFELQIFQNEIFNKFKEIGVSFEQAEIFLNSTKQILKKQKLG